MTELSFNILKLMEEDYSVNQICTLLEISRKKFEQSLRYLKQMGFLFKYKYYYDGEILCTQNKDFDYVEKKNRVNIITNSNYDKFKAMIISDLHIGNEDENMNAWYKIYEYCVLKNIHVVIIAGDFLDGVNIGNKKCKKHDDPLQQIKYACDKYPFDNNILNFLVFGNHDVDFFTTYGIDLSTYLNNYRTDIIPVGYGYGEIKVKNDKILVTHPLGFNSHNSLDFTGNYLLFRGHHHKSCEIINNTGGCSVSVPTLSNVFIHDDTFLPGAMILNVKFKGGFFDSIVIENLLINDKVNVVGETQYNVIPSKDRKAEKTIKYTEDFSKRKILKK